MNGETMNSEDELSIYRYERKFFITSSTIDQVEQILKLHSSMFNEIYHERNINNIYFDTHQLRNYFENVEEKPIDQRSELDGMEIIRTIVNPKLEVKVKEYFGRKHAVNFMSFPYQKN